MSAEGGFQSAVTDSRYNIERLPVAALYERRDWLPVGGHRPPLQASFTKLQIANFA